MSLNRRPVLAALALGTVAANRPARAQTRLRVAGLYTVPVSQPWVGRIDTALKAAAARGEIDYVVRDAVAEADYERVLRELATQGFALIVGECFGLEAAVRKVAADRPRVNFLMASSGRPQPPNFSVFDNHIHEPAYLSGMAAAGASQSGKIGLVGGLPTPEVNRLMNAFMAGVREVKPTARFQVAFIDTWSDPARARHVALGMIDAGVDVLYAEREGVAEAARERQVLAIGNVVNLQERFPDTVLTSAVWHVEPTINLALRNLRAGSFAGDDYALLSGLRYRGSSLAPLGPLEGRLPRAVLDRVAARAAEMRAGSFKVRLSDARPQSSAP